MYSVGLQAASDAFLLSSWTTQLAVAALGLGAILSIVSCHCPHSEDAPLRLPVQPLLCLRPFYRRRHDFLRDGFAIVGQQLFQFSLLGRTVVAVSGDVGRKAFFTTKSLDLHAGFQDLSGAIPVVKGVTSDLHTRSVQLIQKRLIHVQKADRISQLQPIILDDCKRIMTSWGSSGVFDPFDKIYELIFQFSVRLLSCDEIADDLAVVHRLKSLYDRLDRGNTPLAVLLPLFPSPSAISNWWSTKQIYDIIMGGINTRLQSGVPRNDTLQLMLDYGDDKVIITGFMMGLIVASARSTGTTAAWLITYLGMHPEWQAKAKVELQALLDAHPSPECELTARLAAVPLDAWEQATPTLDAIIHETLRLAQPHVAMRRNLGPEFHIGDKVIPTGTYLTYSFSDAHLNPEFYPDPWTFDPSRPPTKEPFSYFGWGSGSHVCQGQRLARFEIKLLSAMFLFGYEYTVVDKTGQPAHPLPRPNWNDTLTCRPENGSCQLMYRRTSQIL